MLMRTTLIASAALAFVASVVEAHSYVDCTDWRFNNPAKPGWGENDGKCVARGRQYPINNGKPFGTLDSFSPNRHYQQGKDMLPCSTGKDSQSAESGADETRQNPISKAYDGSKFGPMAKATAGDTICMRWPSKNHAFESRIEKVHINMPQTLLTQDPDQKGFDAATIATIPYENCTSTGDKDLTPCGGCFTVPPTLQTGDYVVQWRWLLVNSGVEEYYTSCWDIGVTARDSSAPIPLGPYTNVFGGLIPA